jgi:kynurenine formamidase
MQIRSFVIAYALVLAILLFADRRPGSSPQDRYSHVVDLTNGQTAAHDEESNTKIIAPGALIPGTWAAGQIPAERLIAPLVVMDLAPEPDGRSQISLDDIADWETHHGMIPQGAVIAIRRAGAFDFNGPAKSAPSAMALSGNAAPADSLPVNALPVKRDAAQFLIDARYTIGFAVETPVNLTSDRVLARQLALHGSYVLEETARFTSLPASGSLIIVAPAKNKKPGETPVRILAMVK